MRKTYADIREEKLDRKLQALAAQGDWDGVLQALDEFDANNERRESDHRAAIDATITDRDPREGEQCRAVDLLRLSRCENWDDIIFSRRPEDLYQLIEESPISAALRELTPVQKSVLFDNTVLGIPVKRVARRMGCSDRNVTKHRQRALEKIRLRAAGKGETKTGRSHLRDSAQKADS